MASSIFSRILNRLPSVSLSVVRPKGKPRAELIVFIFSAQPVDHFQHTEPPECDWRLHILLLARSPLHSP